MTGEDDGKGETIPEMRLFTGLNLLGDIDSSPKEAEVLHNTFGMVFSKSDTKLGEHSHVASFQTKTGLEKADELIKVAVALILLNKLGKLLSVHDEVETTDLGKAELLLRHTGFVDLPPDLDVVRLPGTFNCCLVVLQMDERSRKLGPVGDVGEENLGSLVVALLVGLVTRSLDICNIGGTQEILELGQLVGTSKAEGQGSIDRYLAESLAGHPQVLDQLLILASMSGDLNDFQKVGWVASTDVGLDRVSDTKAVQLRLCNLAPHLRGIDAFSKVLSTVDAHNVIDEHADGVDRPVVLLVHLKRLVEHADFDALFGNIFRGVVLQLVDVVHHPSSVRLGGCQHEQVLERGVVAECGRLENDLLEQLNQLGGHIVCDEGLDGEGDTVWVSRFRHCSGSDLINQGATMHVVLVQNKVPNFRIGAFEEVACLGFEHGVLVRDIDELKVVVALAVCNEGQVGVALLAVFTDNECVILVVLLEELLRVVVA
jgi:hypothetical protein